MCLGELQPKESVRVTPCVHVFHVACVDKWFAKSPVGPACPTCKRACPMETSDEARR